MTTALNIFRSLCTVFIGKHNSNTVLIHLKAMKDFIKECRIPDMEEGDKLGDSPLTQEEDDEERRNAHTAVGRSPFTYEFRKVMEEVTCDLYDGAIGFVNIRNVHWRFSVKRVGDGFTRSASE
ncbi:hypothetical protein JOQ06_000376 [Pogonophryne albipinna]|uniref:Uncharacterized protein n=1 Tax=Pogonophryne albipinna TaxID=1090488 RepID=A0AAD6AG91_9TELE|nr:hypothetical protein JOQ06_000376 [Pogonophryne albipinna]